DPTSPYRRPVRPFPGGPSLRTSRVLANPVLGSRPMSFPSSAGFLTGRSRSVRAPPISPQPQTAVRKHLLASIFAGFEVAAAAPAFTSPRPDLTSEDCDHLGLLRLTPRE